MLFQVQANLFCMISIQFTIKILINPHLYLLRFLHLIQILNDNIHHFLPCLTLINEMPIIQVIFKNNFLVIIYFSPHIMLLIYLVIYIVHLCYFSLQMNDN